MIRLSTTFLDSGSRPKSLGSPGMTGLLNGGGIFRAGILAKQTKIPRPSPADALFRVHIRDGNGPALDVFPLEDHEG